ncbi:MAG: hypothetical protein DRJ05_09195 [Bacteroidetes bacterium]|nr:MAG: hypothetical protein DRJ05_09195 [Bacteroidota bacterium]
MKNQKYLLILICFIAFLQVKGQVYDSISYPVVYTCDTAGYTSTTVNPDRSLSELFDQNIWLPNIDGGIIPRDIIEVEYGSSQTKIYVYGKSRIYVFNPSNFQHINTIDISEVAQYNEEPAWIEQMFSPTNYFAYNETDELLYCVTEERKIIEIDPSNDSFDEVIEWYGYYDPIDLYTTTFLKFDDRTNRLYWVVEQLANDSYLFVYNTTNYSLVHYEKFDGDRIKDIEVNEDLDEFYLSIDKEYRVYNTSDYSYSTISNGSNYSGDLLYINEGTGGIHKLFCFTKDFRNVTSYVKVLDFNTTGPETSFTQPNSGGTTCYYNPADGYVYVGLRGTDDLWIFDPDATGYTTIDEIDTRKTQTDEGEYNEPLSITNLDGYVIIGKYHETVAVKRSDYSVELVKEGYRNEFFRTISNADKAFIIGTNTGTIDIVEIDVYNDVVLEDPLNIGANVRIGEFNPSTNKAYFYNDALRGNSEVIILNTLTNEINTVVVAENISDLVINEDDNKILVSTYDGSTKIKVIDGDTDELLPDQNNNWIQLGYQFHSCISMFLAPDDYLYCLVRNANGNKTNVVVYDVDNGYSVAGYKEYAPEEIDGEFCYNPVNTNVYVTVREIEGTSYSNFTEITKRGGISFQDYTVSADPFHMACNIAENKIIVGHIGESINYLSIFDCGSPTPGFSQLTIPGIEYYVFDLEYDEANELVYAAYNNTSTSGEIALVKANTVAETISVPLYTTSLKYYSGNGLMYAYNPFNNGNDNEAEVWQIAVTDDGSGGFTTQTTSVPLTNKHFSKDMDDRFRHDLLINPVNNKLYVANALFSNVSVVNLPEIYLIDTYDNKDYKWLSFPRLERINNGTVSVQTALGGNRIVPNTYNNGSNLQFMALTEPQGPVYNTVTNDDWQSGGNLPNVQSTLGYKLNLHYTDPYPDNIYLNFYGTVLDENENVVVYDDKECWVGYWLYEEQSPFEAIPESVLDYLDLMKSERWVCVKEWLPVNGMLEPQWVCATHTGSSPTLRYADMVILESFANQDISFSWINSGSTTTSSQKTAPEYYEYEEQADYTSYIIELDATDNPEEIAAFVGDTCVGASKVLPADTAVLVPGFTEGFEGEVTFEEYYGVEKSGKPALTSYYVNNAETRTWDKRSIHTSEDLDHYLISFKKDNETNSEQSIINEVSIWPNPASDKIQFNIQAQKGTFVQISLLDIAGWILDTPFAKEMHSESISGEIKLVDNKGHQLKPGIYLLEIKAGQYVETKKIIVK